MCEQPVWAERTTAELILPVLTQNDCLAFADAAYCTFRYVHAAPAFLQEKVPEKVLVFLFFYFIFCRFQGSLQGLNTKKK